MCGHSSDRDSLADTVRAVRRSGYSIHHMFRISYLPTKLLMHFVFPE